MLIHDRLIAAGYIPMYDGSGMYYNSGSMLYALPCNHNGGFYIYRLTVHGTYAMIGIGY